MVVANMASISATISPTTLNEVTNPAVHHAPSIFVTFKVAQLVNAFRKRVKTRVLSRTGRTSSIKVQNKIHEEFCQEFERQAFEEIDKYLGRKTIHGHGRGRPTSRFGSKTVFKDAAEDGCHTPIRSWEPSLASLLEQLDAQTWFEKSSLTTIVKHDGLFLEHAGRLRVNHLSPKELTALLSLLLQLLTSVKSAHQHCFVGIYQLCDGKEVFQPGFDESDLAKLEHILLCLRIEVLHAIVEHGCGLVQKHLIECQKLQRRRCEEWFFEFPDARHPLSTTWPWAIRPSLAVLWGVCWMFHPEVWQFGRYWYDEFGVVIADSDVAEEEEAAHSAAQTSASGTDVPRVLPRSAGAAQPLQAYVASTAQIIDNNADYHDPSESGTNARTASLPLSSPASASAPQDSLGISSHEAASSIVHDESTFWEPADEEGVYPNSLPTTTFAPVPSSYIHTSLPNHRSRDPPVTPTISLTIPPAEPSWTPSGSTYTPTHGPGNPYYQLSPQDLYYQMEESSNRSRASSVSTASSARQATSTSPVSPNNVQSPGGLRPERGEPPTRDNKIICEYPQCSALTFDRKCEWSKHMDKHDRPYRCNDPMCAKLQGFTYSGGLLRHEREVHGKHGGPKEQLLCPEVTCRRNKGAGFTRKENLNEHVRRVHGKTHQSMSSSPSALVKPEHEAEVEEAETPSEYSEIGGAAAGKRKLRMSSPPSKGAGNGMDKEEKLEGEVKRLRSANAGLMERMLEMERKMTEVMKQQKS